MAYTIINLACGNKTSDMCINVDWSIYLRIKRLPFGEAVAPVIFNGDRLKKFRSLSRNIRVHDLSKGIPFPDSSVDAVYHSHFLEHLDRDVAPKFLTEVMRVLKPGGIHRVVVPDFALLCRWYLANLERCQAQGGAGIDHDQSIAAVIDQMVRTEASGTSQQRGVRRFVENLLLGDARARGELHRWMYDEVSLTGLLQKAGYTVMGRCTYQTSNIPRWSDTGLDTDEQGREYKPESLYVEARK